MQTYLINILFFCGIALLLALTVAVVQCIIILIDVHRTSREITKKVRAITSAIDIVSLIIGALGGGGKSLKKKAQDKSTLIAFIAGVRKGLEVLLGRKR